MLNISIRHAAPDPAPAEPGRDRRRFAFVLYYKQRTRENAKRRVAVWTRELIDAALACAGTYYLPYQPHATVEQFHHAYPRARELFELKSGLDPQFRFRGCCGTSTTRHWLGEAARRSRRMPGPASSTGVRRRWRQRRFLSLPAERLPHRSRRPPAPMHRGGVRAPRRRRSHLPPRPARDRRRSSPPLADLTYAVPALVQQKAEMTRQTVQILGRGRGINGYVEIGSKGRYFRSLARALRIEGPLIPDRRGGAGLLAGGHARTWTTRQGRTLRAACRLRPHRARQHLFRQPRLRRLLHRPAPHDAPTSSCRSSRRSGACCGRAAYSSCATTMWAASRCASWYRWHTRSSTPASASRGRTMRAELRHFVAVAEWVRRLEAAGFSDTGERLLQANDPTDNPVMAFVKCSGAPNGLVPDCAPATRTGRARCALHARGGAAGRARRAARAPARPGADLPHLPGVVPRPQSGRVRRLRRAGPPSGFPLPGHIGQFWQGYSRGDARTRARVPVQRAATT